MLRLASSALFVGLLATAGTAHAFEPFAFLVPCRATATNGVGTVRPCITCHNNADGGGGCASPPCLNQFGTAFNANGRTWNAALAALDSDGDGYTNGEELGDPEGMWRPSMGIPDYCDCATGPGQMSLTPGDADRDMDGYCCIGRDTSMPPNRTCRDSGERTGGFDCDDMDALASSAQAEICTDTQDNDCDGLPTVVDPDCASVVDRDGDGFCPMGRDNNGDGNCITNAAERTSDVDCDDDEPSVYPGAAENCADTRDNDCNGLTDRADPRCTSDVDVDMDGYCPIGRDFSPRNGNCNDPGELEAGLDCNDMNAAVNSGVTEICGDGVDNDCNGLVDFRDGDACAGAYDFDNDGYCALGQDLEPRDRYCTTPDELAAPRDCNDMVATINPGAMEMCASGVDNNCDGRIGIADPQCVGYLDRDGDRYCPVGFDMNRNGNCIDAGEETGNGDCNDDDPAVNPTATEICTDGGVDNDCDGVADAADRGSCLTYVDHDRDGYCIVGRDGNGDRDCDDAGEQGGPSEIPTTAEPILGTDLDPTVYPGAPENCLDRKDNDMNGVVDDPSFCTRDTDIDGDGYCPIGRDLNGDGDCLDTGENLAVTDCNEGRTDVNPGAAEMCREIIDMDCDGDWGKRDDDCAFLLDRDGDGFCPVGIDDTRDGDCDDAGEDRFGMDCNDDDAAINARASERCDDGVDNDCDGNVDYADSQCVCETAAQCDDNDPCTRDTCAEQRCTWTPDPSCGDGGMLDGGTGGSEPSCACRAVGGSTGQGTAGILGWLLVAAVLTIRRRRRGR
jgi:MYXO-CTERM domain-containing protein